MDYNIHFIALFVEGDHEVKVRLVWDHDLGLKLENVETGAYISDIPYKLQPIH